MSIQLVDNEYVVAVFETFIKVFKASNGQELQKLGFLDKRAQQTMKYRYKLSQINPAESEREGDNIESSLCWPIFREPRLGALDFAHALSTSAIARVSGRRTMPPPPTPLSCHHELFSLLAPPGARRLPGISLQGA